MGRLLPALRAFNPELVLLSSGFDAAQSDVGNGGVGNSGGLDLLAEDFFWVTKEIQLVSAVSWSLSYSLPLSLTVFVLDR